MRLFHWLLRLFPASFRNDYGREMGEVFAERRRAASGPGAVSGLWIETLADMVGAGLRAHLDILRQDLRVTGRGLLRAPGFALTVVTVVALGIGANTAVFTVTDHVLLRPLPYDEPARLVQVWERHPEYRQMEASPPNFKDWQAMSTSFESMAAYTSMAMNLLGRGDPQRVRGTAVTGDLFELLGAQPLAGRALVSADGDPGAEPVIVLGYGLWQSAFGGDERILGTTVTFDTGAYEVVGLMPRGFAFPRRDSMFWIPRHPLSQEDEEDRNNHYLQVVGLLAPGFTREQAQIEMGLVGERLQERYPEDNGDKGVSVYPMRDSVSNQSRLLLLALAGAAGCVLLIACLNVANLLLARTLARQRELTVRTALGAGRERLVRQLLTESLVLATLGGAAGIGLGALAVPLLARLVPSNLPIPEATALDPRVMLFAGLATLVTGLAFGVLPALRIAGRKSLSGALGSSRTALGARTEKVRSALVVGEVATSIALLVAAGLLVQALWRVQEVNPGFDTEGILAVSTPLPYVDYGETAKRVAYYDQVLSRVRGLPGVENAAFISFLPMTMTGGIWEVTPAGAEERERPSRASLRFVTPGFFDTLDIPIESGRDVATTDTQDTLFVAVVSRSFAESYFPGQDPLGRRFDFAFQERTIVGVVGDIRVRGLERSSEPQVYVPSGQVPDQGLVFYMPKDLAIRTSLDPMSLAPQVRAAIREVAPQVPVSSVRPLTAVLDEQTAPRQAQLRVLGAFAGLALLLAGIGIHGLLSFAVSQRTREIGLRMALGARAGDILAMVLREGVWLAAVGGAVGLGLAWVAGRTLESILAGVQPANLWSLAVACGLTSVMTLSGSLLPALRASRVPPTTALRED
ncbi:MAG: ABC transporter permease [Acidobacteriota bacterium]